MHDNDTLDVHIINEGADNETIRVELRKARYLTQPLSQMETDALAKRIDLYPYTSPLWLIVILFNASVIAWALVAKLIDSITNNSAPNTVYYCAGIICAIIIFYNGTGVRRHNRAALKEYINKGAYFGTHTVSMVFTKTNEPYIDYYNTIKNILITTSTPDIDKAQFVDSLHELKNIQQRCYAQVIAQDENNAAECKTASIKQGSTIIQITADAATTMNNITTAVTRADYDIVNLYAGQYSFDHRYQATHDAYNSVYQAAII